MSTDDRKLPPWVKQRPLDPWINIEEVLPWLRYPPFLAGRSREAEAVAKLASVGFAVIEVEVQPAPAAPERSFLQAVSGALGFRLETTSTWAGFSDRMGDFVTAESSDPVVVIVKGLDRWLESDIHAVFRCVHLVYTVLDGIVWGGREERRQVEFVFVGEWPGLEAEAT